MVFCNLCSFRFYRYTYVFSQKPLVILCVKTFWPLLYYTILHLSISLFICQRWRQCEFSLGWPVVMRDGFLVEGVRWGLRSEQSAFLYLEELSVNQSTWPRLLLVSYRSCKMTMVFRSKVLMFPLYLSVSWTERITSGSSRISGRLSI